MPKMRPKEREQRAKSERIVMMRVGLITEDGIVGFSSSVLFSCPIRREREAVLRRSFHAGSNSFLIT